MSASPIRNPFHDLWLTEHLTPVGFVRLFSPIVAMGHEMLFSAGNIVVKGRQGSGKSMLLSLLDTDTRIAYARAGVPYPGRSSRPFISAGVNLTRENVRLVVARIDEVEIAQRERRAAALFSDYVNYLLAADLIRNILSLAQEQNLDRVLMGELCITLSPETEGRFVKSIVSSESWVGYLDGCNSIQDIFDRIKHRLASYNRYFNYNGDLDDRISSSGTELGQPIAEIAEALKLEGVLPPDTMVFLRLDQHEELYVLERVSGFGSVFRQVINRALAMRDPRISYRIGTRHYAWDDSIVVWGSGASLENLRDYNSIDIDEYFKRPESKSVKWEFPAFAEDVFRKRLMAAGYDLDGHIYAKPLDYVFGKTPLPAARARSYAAGSPPQPRIDPGWHETWIELLNELWKSDPLSARLGEAFLRQRNQIRSGMAYKAVPTGELPWETKAKRWWRKERLEVAAMQIASERNQSLIWGGSKHIVELAGWNILPFMTVCKTVWGAWNRNVESHASVGSPPPQIGISEQTVGILEASKIWFEKLQEGIYGDRRKRLVSNLGAWFAIRLRADKALSYPGSNGFSLLRDEMQQDSDIVNLIRECRDQGDLLQSDHTTKLSDSKLRLKWYLNPILAPFFRITQGRTKEPIYTSVPELSRIYLSKPVASADDNLRLSQKDLFE
ncbi:hypothetical protein HFK18_20670|uniref:ORC-CDC6 family AAA ATPase n=1 Tax=Stenotrophomonas sp. SbOxS2 TaxID=2723885 RepID=UPI0015D2E130|nr:hypothetical protein [Stenotrophomonas sp. SbOxS2]NYU00882.1 hypothetical protein [Stenotrophomonas sp. SbOxS2]